MPRENWQSKGKGTIGNGLKARKSLACNRKRKASEEEKEQNHMRSAM